MLNKILVFLLISIISNGALNAQENIQEKEDFFVAQKAYEDGFYDISLKYLENFINKYPHSENFHQALILKARCLINLSKFFQAKKTLEELLTMKISLEQLSEVYYLLGELNFKGKNYEEAKKFYTTVIKDFSDSEFFGPSLYSRGWIEYLQHKYQQAIEDFLKAKKVIKDSSLLQDIYFKLVQMYYQMREFKLLQDTIQEYRRRFKTQPLKDYFSFYEALIWYEKKDLDKAKEMLLKLTDSYNLEVRDNVFYRLGMIALDKHNFKEAEVYAKRIKSEQLRNILWGYIYTKTKNYQKALDFYDRLLKKKDISSQMKAEILLGKANVLYNLGRLKDAVYIYKKVIKEYPHHPLILNQAHYNLGWAYLKLQEFKKAIEEFRKVSQEIEDPLVKVSILCHIGDVYQDSGQFAKALQTYDEILEKYPESIYADYIQFQIGNTLLKMGKFTEAVLAFKFLKEKYPTSSFIDEATYSIGLAYFMNKNFTHALKVLKQFLEKFKNSNLRLEALYLLSEVYFNLHNYKKQQEVLDEILKRFSFNESLVQEACLEKAVSLYFQGRKLEAIRFLERVLSGLSTEKSQEALFWIAQVWEEKGEYKKAKESYLASYKINKDKDLSSQALFKIGSILWEQENFQEAIFYLEKVLKEYPHNKISLQAGLLLSKIYAQFKEEEKFNKLMQELLKNFPAERKNILRRKAKGLEEMEKFKEALHIYNILEEEGFRSFQFYLDWGQLLERMGENQEAVNLYLKAIYLFPEDKEQVFKAYMRIAKIYEDEKKFERVYEIYKKISLLGEEYKKIVEEKLQEFQPIIKRRR